MKINFDQELKGLDGEALKEGDKAFTLKRAAVEALVALAPDDRANGEEKCKRWQLAVRVNGGGEVELSPEEAAMVKERIGRLYGPLVIGPAWQLLNG
jgi:hypothetical protein